MATRAASEWPRAKHWRKILQKWKHSHQTPAAFCQEHQLNTGTFLWWRGQLKKATSVNRVAAKPSTAAIPFMEIRRSDVPAAETSEKFSHYELQINSGRKIVVREGFSEAALLQLIRLMERAEC